MDEQLQQRYAAMARDAGEDELLRHMFETMSAAPPPGGDVYDREMGRLYDRYPNQWVLYREDWNEPMSELSLAVLGPFRTQAEAVGCWDGMSADERAGYTLVFLEVPAPGCVVIGSPVIGFAATTES